MNWKKGRGKLGIFEPLIGSWRAEANSDIGSVIVHRHYSKTLNNKYLQLKVHWQLPQSNYEELALIGTDANKDVAFWSFTSDGKQSNGRLTVATDLHDLAIGFESQMPAGLARQVYWPNQSEGFHWVVESKTKKGWNRFVEHHYLKLDE